MIGNVRKDMTEIKPAQSKPMLAKLLAMENITVRRNANARTASFDVKNRILEMPNWKGISQNLEDMLTVHEVGHALDTPSDGWMDAIKSISEKFHDNPSSRHTMAVKGFLNVIEDARIDKRQKRRYPGTRRDYLIGYGELIERGFFGPKNKDFNTFNLIDRINIYFKGGVNFGIKFSPEEMTFVKRIENAETFDDVLLLTEEIYGYCKSIGDTKAQTPIDVMMEEEYDDLEEDDYNLEYDEDSDDLDNSSLNDFDGASDEDDASDEADDITNRGDDASDEDGDFVPEAKTENTWQEKQLELSDTNIDYVYVTIPKPIMENIVDDYKVVLPSINSKIKKWFFMTSNTIEDAAKDFNKYKISENNTISFMVKEFEMKKAADLYSKISIAKTGVLDTNKIHSYRYNDDIFRRNSILPQGKNHGFIMFLDWSGSMIENFSSTVKQLIAMTLFCKRLQIPFEVYSFRDCQPDFAENTMSFVYKNNDMKLSSFKLRNLLSSRMNLSELNAALINLWFFGNIGYQSFERMGGTPLNSAIVAATELVNEFRNRNKLQIVNTIFLTDGCSNPINGIHNNDVSSFSSRKKKYVLQDEKTKKEIMFDSRIDSRELTGFLLSSLKEQTGCNLIGFFLYSPYGWYRSFNSIYSYFFPGSENEKHLSEMKKSWTTNMFMPVKSSGYDEYFIINAKTKVNNDEDLHINSNMTKNKIAKQFLNFASKKTINRVLLKRFIDLTAKLNAA
jgi:hypothetical protein